MAVLVGQRWIWKQGGLTPVPVCSNKIFRDHPGSRGQHCTAVRTSGRIRQRTHSKGVTNYRNNGILYRICKNYRSVVRQPTGDTCQRWRHYYVKACHRRPWRGNRGCPASSNTPSGGSIQWFGWWNNSRRNPQSTRELERGWRGTRWGSWEC